jgi:hypothetical protein
VAWSSIQDSYTGGTAVKIRVQRVNGTTDTIELADSGWHILHVADLNCLVGAGLTHSFTSEGFYYGTAETPAITYVDAEVTP